MAAAPQIPMAAIMLITEIGDRVCRGEGWVTSVVGVVCRRVVVVAETSVPDTSVLLPAATFTEDCQSWYPFSFKMME
jgi:hypothetical protein